MKLVEAIKNKEEQETQVIWSDTCPECGEKATYTEIYGYGWRLEYDWLFICPRCNYTKYCPAGNILSYHSLMERKSETKRADLRSHPDDTRGWIRKIDRRVDEE